MHLFPQLRKLEDKYPESLVVLGIHSAKYTTEKETDNIRSAVIRYDIRHPVVNDADFKVWKDWGKFVSSLNDTYAKYVRDDNEAINEEWNRFPVDLGARLTGIVVTDCWKNGSAGSTFALAPIVFDKRASELFTT